MKGKLTVCWTLLAAFAAAAPLTADAARKQQNAQPEAAAPAQAEPQVQQVLEAWRLAWELGEADTYLRFYDVKFQPQRGSRSHWEKERRARLDRKEIAVRLENVRTRRMGDGEVQVRFVQHYASGGVKDVGEKRMKMRRVNGAWRITHESWRRR
jgi:hypothetical protein